MLLTFHLLFLLLQYVFDYRPGDMYACVADIGWITGHSYVVYSPLCNGATTVLFESIPTYPDPGIWCISVECVHLRAIDLYTIAAQMPSLDVLLFSFLMYIHVLILIGASVVSPSCVTAGTVNMYM